MKDFIYIVVIIILSVWLMENCEDKRTLEKYETQNEQAIKDTVQYYKNRLGQEVAEKKALRGLESDIERLIQDNQQLKEAIRKFKQVETVTRVVTETKIDTIEIPFEKPVSLNFQRSFFKLDDYYSIGGEVDQNGVKIDSVIIPNEQAIVIGEKKTGFFKSEFRVEVTNSNPMIKVTDVDGYDFEVPKKRFGVGPYAGYGMTPNGLSPQVGIGVSYDIIQF